MKNKSLIISAIGFGGLAAAVIGTFVLLSYADLAHEKEPPKNASIRPRKNVRQADLIGKPAPDLSIEKLLQAPEGSATSWASLRGKCVVLELWATWCPSCVAAIPHMNELRKQFKDRPIVFIAVTDEPEAKISAFLKRRPINGWIGLDTNSSLFDDYGIRTIPQTVLVDAKGTTAAITSPERVTTNVIESLLTGRPLDLPKRDGISLNAGTDPLLRGQESNALYQILIRPSIEKLSCRAGASGRMTMVGSKPSSIISTIYEILPCQVDIKADLPEGPFDIIAAMPQGREGQLHPSLCRAFESAFRITTRREKREMDVYLLKRIKGQATKLTPSAMNEKDGTSLGVSSKRIDMINESMGVLAAALGSQLNKPVFNETDLQGRYDLILEGELNTPDSLNQTLRETLGLELRPDKRPVEFLVIENDSADEKGK